MPGSISPATSAAIWLNHHFYKGMPGDYSPAQIARTVPGVTGACLVTRKEIYDLVGGFTEDYVIGDYEDSDLCLKIRQIGFQIAYEPACALYHFERRSIRRSSDYMRGSRANTIPGCTRSAGTTTSPN